MESDILESSLFSEYKSMIRDESEVNICSSYLGLVAAFSCGHLVILSVFHQSQRSGITSSGLVGQINGSLGAAPFPSPHTASSSSTTASNSNSQPPTSPESMYVSAVSVAEAFAIASRIMASHASATVTQLSSTAATLELPPPSSSLYRGMFGNGTCAAAAAVTETTSNYALMMGRLTGEGGLGGGGTGLEAALPGGKWSVDKHYRRLMEMNNIPRDPGKWNSTQVRLLSLCFNPFGTRHFLLSRCLNRTYLEILLAVVAMLPNWEFFETFK